MKTIITTLLSVVLFICLSLPQASGIPTSVDVSDGPQDPLLPLEEVHELGTSGAFNTVSPNELISASAQATTQQSCFEPGNEDNPSISNQLVTITNLTGVDWYELHYVADPDTTLTNEDGLINGAFAFRIDNVGQFNFPLVFESIATDNIFQAGETWEFIIQDYNNTFGLPASALGSVGVGMGSGGDTQSSGSIIASTVPEPSTVGLILAGLLGLLLARKNHKPSTATSVRRLFTALGLNFAIYSMYSYSS